MTTSELERQLLKLPLRDKLRIIGLLLKNMISLEPAPAESAKYLQSNQPESSLANTQQSWPELLDFLAGAWPDFPSGAELRADFEADIPRKRL